MKIKREIRGVQVEIELTDSEMLDVFYEMQHRFDMTDIKEHIELDFEYDEDFYQEYGHPRTIALKLISEMADLMRKKINTYDEAWLYYRDEAIAQILSEHSHKEINDECMGCNICK